MKIKLTLNVAEAIRALRKMKADVRAVNERCLKRAVIQTIERDAKKVYGQGHPGTPVRTSRLRRSIHTETVPRVGRDRGRVQTGTNVEYAWFVHQGHWTRGRKRFIEGRPYLYGAMEAMFEQCNAAYAKCLNEALKL